MSKFFELLNGWKTVLAYIAAQALGSYPLLLASINAVLADPKNPQAVVDFAIQLALALGIGHRLFKNLVKKS